MAWRLTRVWVGLMPTRPLAAAGRRTEPPVSDPSAPNTRRAATADPDPLDEPPEMCAGFQGLRHAPKCALLAGRPVRELREVEPPDIERAGRVEPRKDGGGPVRHEVTPDLRATGAHHARPVEHVLVGEGDAVERAPSPRRPASARSAASAWWRASSASKRMKQLRAPAWRSMRSMQAEVTSREESSPERMRSATSPKGALGR